MTIKMFEDARRIAKLIAALVLTGFLAACGDKGVPEDQVYTLYTNAPSDPAFRTGIATFDMNRGEEWNHHFCNRSANFFQADWEDKMKNDKDPSIKLVKHWCEKGRFRK